MKALCYHCYVCFHTAGLGALQTSSYSSLHQTRGETTTLLLTEPGQMAKVNKAWRIFPSAGLAGLITALLVLLQQPGLNKVWMLSEM